MIATIENLEGLERRMHITVPPEQVQTKYQERLNKLSKTVKLDGFRPGKVPLSVVEQRFGSDILSEACWELVESSFQEALKEKAIHLAGRPHHVEPNPFLKNQALEYKITFEVFPEIHLKDLSGVSIEKPVSSITDADLDKTLEKIRAQQAEWKTAERPSKEGDSLMIDFEGFLDGVAFEGGKAADFQLELGAKKMIPGFEEPLVGAKAGDEKTIQVTFPEDYQAQHLAAKAVEFKIKVHKVLERHLPELNDALVEKMGLKEGGVLKLREQVQKGMNSELKQALSNRLKTLVLEKLLELNPMALPKAAVDDEIKHLQNAAVHRMMRESGMPHADDHGHPEHKHPNIELPRELFLKQAERRVSLGLLLSEVIKQAGIKQDPERVRTKITEMAEVYQQPQQVIDWYYRNPQLLSEVESAVLEEMAIQHLLEKAKVSDKTLSFDEVVNTNSKEESLDD